MPHPDLALCYGPRPQVLRASVLRREPARLGSVFAVDLGHHYDDALSRLLAA